MNSETENINDRELLENELARNLYRLNTLYDLNQEISTLRNIHEVLRASLLYIIGVFGLNRGLIVIYNSDEDQPREFSYRGLIKSTANSCIRKLKSLMKEDYVPKTYVVKDNHYNTDSLLGEILKEGQFYIWLPLSLDEENPGGIALGAKLSGMLFTELDMELLSTITINIQNVLSNVSLIEALNQSVIKETHIRNIFQRYAPESIVNTVLNPSNEELLLDDSESVRSMFENMINHLEEQFQLEKDLNHARDIQKHLLPEKLPTIPGFSIAASSIPARLVCGDFYDFIPLSSQDMALAIADVSGKGASAAMIAIMLQTAIRMCVGVYYPISAILSILNRFIMKHTDNSYASIFYGMLNVTSQTLTYSNAGHPPPILYHNRETKLLETGGTVIGIFDDSVYEQETVKLQSNDVLVIYSDGVTDAGIDQETGSENDAFGQQRLEEVIVANVSLPAEELLKSINDEVTKYAHKLKQFDDITLIVIKAD
ncbi:MAG: phosphoserine phosphatase RsbU/P [Candidatus Poribacteria bacterium]|nr:phosphoserine phosphatase RsbU/P [Candidatus Poribacteria bacterium]